MSERGFTILEMSIAAAMLSMIFGAAAVAISGDKQTHRALVAQTGAEMRGQLALEKIAAELRLAGEWGEDRNHDGQLDEGEDTNGNGVLDANWSLVDGAKDADVLTFNTRIDDRVEGETAVSGIYSRKITYRLEEGGLIREWARTDLDEEVEVLRSVVATGLSALRFSRKGSLVTYTSEVKSIAGVDPAVIEKHGVVSKEVSEAMAEAVRVGLNADVGIGVTGVAGPGPSEGIPAGTVFAGVAMEGITRSTEMRFPPDRPLVKRRAVVQALLLVYRLLLESR